jgi:hypothetical protein
MDDLLREIFETSKPTILERCEVVRAGATSIDVEAWAIARASSHKLAGSVGMFGLVVAGELATRMDALVSDGALEDDRRDAVAAMAVELAAAVEEER